eukprot:scaffold1708_cov117-Isochrysis_galbana.AAC.7
MEPTTPQPRRVRPPRTQPRGRPPQFDRTRAAHAPRSERTMRRGRNRTAMAEIVIWREIWAETAISVLEIAIWVETGATPGSGVRAAC